MLADGGRVADAPGTDHLYARGVVGCVDEEGAPQHLAAGAGCVGGTVFRAVPELATTASRRACCCVGSTPTQS